MQRFATGFLVVLCAGLVVVAAVSYTKINHLERQLSNLTTRVDEMQMTRATPAH